MKKCLTVLFAVALLLGGVVGVQANPSPTGPPSTSGGSKGKGASTDKYSTGYYNNIGGNWEVTGVRVVNKNYVKDSFSGTISDINLMPAGTYTGANWGWSSDFNGAYTANFTITVTDNGDGTGSVSGEAYY